MGRPKKNAAPIVVVSSRADEIERHCVRLELAWRKVPSMRLGELITAAQKHTLASQAHIVDEALVTAVERFADEESEIMEIGA